MPDDLERSLNQFDEGLAVHPLPALEVRRRGDRLRRRNVVLATVGGVAAAVVFVGVPVAVFAGGDGGDNLEPAPSPNPTQTGASTEPTPTEFDVPFSAFLEPDGVGKLRLGMTPAEVAATGEATSQQGSAHDGWRPGCHVLEFEPGLYEEYDPSDLNGRVSLRVGLEEIRATPDMRTRAGIGIGSTIDMVNAAFGVEKRPWDLVKIPASPSARYEIQLGGARVVSMRLVLDSADCEI